MVFSWIRKVHRSCHHPCIVTSAEHCCHELLVASRYCQPRQYNFAVQLCLVCHQFSLWTFQHCDFLVLRCTGRVFHFVMHCQRSCCVRTSGKAVSHGFRQFHRCKPWRLMHQISLAGVFHRPYRSLCSTSTDFHICGLWVEFEGGPLAAPGVHNRYSNPTVAADFRFKSNNQWSIEHGWHSRTPTVCTDGSDAFHQRGRACIRS